MKEGQIKLAGRLAATIVLWLAGMTWAQGIPSLFRVARDGEEGVDASLTWENLLWDGDLPESARIGERMEWTVQIRKKTWMEYGEYGWWSWEDVGEADAEWSVNVVQPDGTPLEGNATAGEWGGKWTLGFETSQAGIHLVFATLKLDEGEFTQSYVAVVHAGDSAFGLTRASDNMNNQQGRVGISGTLVGSSAGRKMRVNGTLSDYEGNLLGAAETILEDGEDAFGLDFGEVQGASDAEEFFVTLRLCELGGDAEADEEYDDGEENEAGEEAEKSEEATYEAETDARDGRFVRTADGWEYRSQMGMELTWSVFDQIAPADGGTGVPDLSVAFDIEHERAVAGTYEMFGTLRMGDGTLLGTSYGTAKLEAEGRTGTQEAEMVFDGESIATRVVATGEEGPFYLVLNDMLFRNEEKGIFEPCGKCQQGGWEANDWLLWVVCGSEKERLVASAGENAACDLLVSLDVSFGKEMGGEYEISAWLSSFEDYDLWTKGTGSVTLFTSEERGTQTVALRFDGGILAESGVDGPYWLDGFRLENEEWSHEFIWNHETGAWCARDFAEGPEGDADVAAEIGWKYLKATGTWFARLRVAFAGGSEVGVENLRYLFADRKGKDGKTVAGLWSSRDRAAVAATEEYDGVTYRVVPLDTGALEDGKAVFGVQDLDAEGVPLDERTIEMYVRKRVAPEGGNEEQAEVEDFVGYVAWNAGGASHVVPVVGGDVAKELAQLRMRSADELSRPVATSLLNESLAVGVTLGDGSEGYCTVVLFQTDGKMMSGNVEVGAMREGKMRRGALGPNARLILLGAATVAGPYEETVAVETDERGAFALEVPEGTAFFRFRLDADDTLK